MAQHTLVSTDMRGVRHHVFSIYSVLVDYIVFTDGGELMTWFLWCQLAPKDMVLGYCVKPYHSEQVCTQSQWLLNLLPN